jgi:hypothetical protein
LRLYPKYVDPVNNDNNNIIQYGQMTATLKIAAMHLNNQQDLIHKAGWMLRGIFRYAVEGFPEVPRRDRGVRPKRPASHQSEVFIRCSRR